MDAIFDGGCDVGVVDADELAGQVVDEDHDSDRHHATPKEDARRCTIIVCHRWR